VIPVVLALVLWKVLPESPRYLAKRRERWPELTKTMRRIGHNIPDDVEYTEASAATAPSAAPRQSASIGSLFGPTFVRDTLALCASFFFCLMVNYIVILLLPAMLTGKEVGFTQPAASRALAMSNYGGVVGAVLGALVIQRLGSRITMLGMSAAAIVCALVLTGTPLNPNDTIFLMVMLLLTGGLLNAVQTTMYALAAHVYPTEIRGTGVGFAVAVGRIGNVLAGFVGNYALEQGGSPGYFTSMAILMGIVFLSLAAVRRHVPRTTGLPVRATAGAH
jgi:AAHS family 4-hydroxybenzoate transporter-like MFS transporter